MAKNKRTASDSYFWKIILSWGLQKKLSWLGTTQEKCWIVIARPNYRQIPRGQCSVEWQWQGKAGQLEEGRCQFELGRLLTGTGRSINLHHPFMLNTRHFYEAPSMCGFKSQNRYVKVKGTHTYVQNQILPWLSALFVRHNSAQAWGWLIRHLTPSPPNPQTSPKNHKAGMYQEK